MNNNIRQRTPPPQRSKPWQWWIEKVIMPILLAMIPGYFLLLSAGVIENPFKSQPTPSEISTVPPTEAPIEIPTKTSTATFLIEASATPTSVLVTPSPTEVTLSPAIQTMDQYFKYINNASISNDLSRAWDLLTQKLQCNPSDQCNFEHFASFWMGFQVSYKLYDCGSNVVDTELIYFIRDTPPPTGKKPVYLRYTLIDEDGQLKLYSAENIDGISAYCPLAVTNP